MELTDPAQLLPWEEGRISEEDQEKLGRFRKAIMKLLQRDPCMRATARQFSEDVRHVFSRNRNNRTVQPVQEHVVAGSQSAQSGSQTTFRI